MFVLIFVNFNPRMLSRKLRTRAQASHGNITVLSLLKRRIYLPNKIAERERRVHSPSKQNGTIYKTEYNLT